MSYQITKSSRLFLERLGLKPTSRGPRQQLAPGNLAINTSTILPDWQQPAAASPEPDGGVTPEPWPTA